MPPFHSVELARPHSYVPFLIHFWWCIVVVCSCCQSVFTLHLHIPQLIAMLCFTMQNPCFVYTVIIHMAVWLQVCYVYIVSDYNYPTKGYHAVLFIGLWPHSFQKIMYLYSICLVSTTCCDTTITLHKRNTMKCMY